MNKAENTTLKAGPSAAPGGPPARGGDLSARTTKTTSPPVLKMIKANNTAVKWDPSDARFRSLPTNYFERAEEITTPVLFVTGEDNKVFTDSNIECHRR